MAKHWSGGDEPADQTDAVDDDPPRPDTDPIGDEAESDRDEQPADVYPEPDEHVPSGARQADRPRTAARGPMTRLVAAVVARLPAAQAAMLPRLTRLSCAV
ncbi:MAG TPA: apolipoprotein N-acyltransferase, partial [Mycobacterium sp.]|nr:apolipoprotein N-acyltransferase [Mycobacterium sp.]